MNTSYFATLMNTPEITTLINQGLISADIDNQQLSFKGTGHIEIKPLFVDEHEEGALVVTFNDAKYIFYLTNFGQLNRVLSTVSEIKMVANSLLGNQASAVAYFLSLDDCSAIQIIDGNRKLESTSILSKKISSNIQWMLRGMLKNKIKKTVLKA